VLVVARSREQQAEYLVRTAQRRRTQPVDIGWPASAHHLGERAVGDVDAGTERRVGARGTAEVQRVGITGEIEPHQRELVLVLARISNARRPASCGSAAPLDS